ncbi:MAG TPA: class II glutamine amidotransferase [Jatrophihabitans sp.]|nr:class II glutamine amidotransferase [Jatrophihabitans sp.]
MLAAAWPAGQRYELLHDWVLTLERFGLASFGWGVAWLDEDGDVQARRGLGRYTDEAAGAGLLDVRSTRFLVHLRRPNKLSTVQFADTQPFTREHDYAFCHNGFFDRAETLRPSYQERLRGGADSEVGWCFVQDRIDEGVEPLDVLREVDETFRGKVNLGYLDRRGALAVYSNNLANAVWRFTARGADLASTSLHSDDDSVFTLVYPESQDRRLVPAGTAVLLGADEVGEPLVASGNGNGVSR